MTNLKSGYVGLFKQPSNKSLLPTLYCMTDASHEVLIMILLTPSAVIDAYNICKNISYTDIYIITPSLDVLFISDLFNLIMKLDKMKPNLKWIYPTNPIISTSIEFELRQLKTDKFIYDDFNHFDRNILIDFIPTNKDGRNFYNLLVRDGNKTRYFSQYMDIENLGTLHNDELIDEIHLPYNSTLYGGLNFNNILLNHNKFHSKCKINSFLSQEEYDFCKERHNLQIGEVRYYDFI